MSRLSYGKNIDFSNVIAGKDCLSVFVPQLFPWEEEEIAEIILSDEFKITANRQAKILKWTDNGIVQIFIPFEREDDRYVCDLVGFLEELGIRTESNGGVCCDGKKWDQNDYTAKALMCRKGMLSLSDSPYWGKQYEFYFADENIRPCLGGRDIKILRFSYCDISSWARMESVFRSILAGKDNWNLSEFNCLLRYVGIWYENRPNRIQVYIENSGEPFDWTDISDLF